MHMADPLKFVGSSTEVLALPELFSVVEKASLPTLSVALQFPDLFDEVAILHRLAYKNNHQHRASKHYQAVCQVLKVFKLFEQLQLPGLLQQLHTAAQRTSLPEAPAAAAAAAATNKRARRQPAKSAAAAAAPSSRQAVRLPSFQAGCLVLRRLLSGVQLLLDLHYIIMTAGQHLSGQLSRGYFMPFCLVAAAAVARIRVLATAALLELLQAYNSVVHLLPLLSTAAASSNVGSGSSSSSSSRFQSVDSHGLPQMLQLAWEGPIPALRTIPFEQQGPQSLQGQAAGLQQTFCITSSSNGSPADQLTLANLAPAAAAAQLTGQLVGAPGMTAGADIGDVGVAISREAFAQQLAGGQEQQQQQQQKDKEGEEVKQLQARQARERAAQLLASRKKQKQQQQQQQQAIAISVYEDKKPEGAAASTAAAAAGDTMALQQEPPAVPLYSTIPGLGLSLGDRLNPAPAVPARPRAAVAAAADIIAARAQPQQQLTARQGGTAAAAAAAAATIPISTAAAAAAEPEPMEVDILAADDQQEYLMLYGAQTTHAQQQQQPAMQPQQHQQQQQRGQPPARKGLQASAALLAMQGQDSSDDFEIVDERPGPAAAAAAVGSGGIQALSNDQAAVQRLPQQAKPPGLLVDQQQPQQQGQQQAQPQQDSSLQLDLQLPREASQQAGFGAQAAQPAATLPGCQLPLGQTSAGASAGVGAVEAAAATTEVALVVGSAVVGGAAAAASAPAPPALQAKKRGKQKKRAQQQPSGAQDTDGAANAPRDSILDMLLQGL